jgi:uncharacterized protein DUF547
MKERERVLATGLTILMLIVWLGFLVHHSPRFAGSFWGGVFGVGGAMLMLVPLAYLIVKRIKRLKKWVTKYVSMRTLLAWHVYAGILGPILVLLHSGHKFESSVGIALTAMTLIVVVSGFVGLYVLKQFSTEIREKKAMLTGLRKAYDSAASELASDPQRARSLRPFSGFVGRVVTSFFVHDAVAEAGHASVAPVTSPATVLRLSESIADLEYAIKTHEMFKAWFGKWLKFHIVISLVLYGLMILHVWAAIHFGLRWFPPTATSYYDRPVVYDSGMVVGGLSSGDGVVSSADASAKTTPGDTWLADTSLAVDDFSRYFGLMFKRYWRSPVLVHGIPTTVFDYAGLAGDVGRPESDYERALAALRRVVPDRLGGGNREKAFWINVYNLGAMKLVAENYPVASITDSKISDGNPWGVPGIQVGDTQYALRQIETDILLGEFGDPRIVFAVSCAAVSCPDRTDEIFSGDRIDWQLDEMIRRLLANPKKGLAIDRERDVVTISWILKADRRLFGDGGDNSLLKFVRGYVSDDVREWMDSTRGGIKIEYFEHDWGLNDIALADGGI